MTSQEHLGFSNHRHLNYLFNRWLRLTIKKTSNFHINDPFLRGLQWWPVDSPHKGPIMQKISPCQDAVMIYNASFTSLRINIWLTIMMGIPWCQQSVNASCPFIQCTLWWTLARAASKDSNTCLLEHACNICLYPGAVLMYTISLWNSW